jgi:hypothetical protein
LNRSSTQVRTSRTQVGVVHHQETDRGPVGTKF